MHHIGTRHAWAASPHAPLSATALAQAWLTPHAPAPATPSRACA